MNIELLNKEIETRLQNLETMNCNSDEYKATVDSLIKLMDRAIEMEKVNNERREKETQIKNDEKDRLNKNIINIGQILLTTAITIWGTKATFRFEETGTITTLIGRGFINKLLPKK